MARKKRTKNKKSTKPNVFVQDNSTQSKDQDIEKSLSVPQNKNSNPVQKNTQNRSIRSRTEVYTKTQSKELRKLAIIGSTNILVIVIISFLI
jgi:hypothetical protein